MGEAQLIDFEYEKFIYNRELIYIYDNVLFEDFLKKYQRKMKKNFHLVDYSSIELQELILKNTIDKSDPKPLYLSNHY